MDTSALNEMYGMMKRDPERLRELLIKNPRILEQLAELDRRYSAAERVSLEGFKTFYKAIYRRELPPVAEPVARSFVRAYESKKGSMVECWRGFGKSTVLIAWVAYLIGARPVGSTAFVRISDAAAKKAGGTVAEIIETNPGWKEIFPHVIPDKDAGWSSENGYHVKDARIEDYNHWLQLCFADHVSEPSLACGGVESGIIIGLHPTNGMWFDDLHDENNTRSLAEMQKVVDLLDGNIISTWFGVSGSPTLGVACTPWSEKDAYVRMMKTGLFEKINIPIFVRQIPEEHPAKHIWQVSLEKYGWFDFPPYGCKVILTWPENFPIEKVIEMYEAGPARFGQMYLLDLETLKGLTLKREYISEYPADKIDPSWPTYFGVDFASTSDKLKVGDTDYFALAIGKILPQGGMVIVGGYRDRVPMHTSIAKIQALSAIHNPVIIAVEKLGGGRQYVEQLIQTTSLPVLPFPLEGTALKSKGQKFESVLSTAFVQGRLWISDVHDDFLNAFLDEWVSWDGGLQRSRTGHDDTLDAVYIASEGAWGNLMIPSPGVKPSSEVRTPHPLDKIGAHVGYGR